MLGAWMWLYTCARSMLTWHFTCYHPHPRARARLHLICPESEWRYT
jgi:hypothetical protein